jgi:hypothetical protein
MARTKRTPQPAPYVFDGRAFHARCEALGLTVVSYQNTSRDGYWLPRDIIGNDGKRLAVFRVKGDPANRYSFDGWDTWAGGQFGGTYETPEGALGWFEWIARQSGAFTRVQAGRPD